MVWQRPGLIGNPGWVRSSACTWLSSSSESITAWADGSTWRPTMSARLAARPGSRERLKVRTRCGRSWCVHQMRSTASTMSAIWDNSENICSLRVFLPVTQFGPSACELRDRGTRRWSERHSKYRSFCEHCCSRADSMSGGPLVCRSTILLQLPTRHCKVTVRRGPR